MARSNFQFKKRQKEIARKKKKEAKRQRKLDKNVVTPEENPDQPQADGEGQREDSGVQESEQKVPGPA